MNFKGLLQWHEGLLEWEGHFRLHNGAIILCRHDEKYKTNLTIHEDYVEIEHLKLGDDGALHPYGVDYTRLESIDYFRIEFDEDDEILAKA